MELCVDRLKPPPPPTGFASLQGAFDMREKFTPAIVYESVKYVVLVLHPVRV